MASQEAAGAFADDFANSLRTSIEGQLRRGGVDGTVISRVKSPDAIARKRTRRSADFINDAIGLRVVVAHRGLLDRAKTAIDEVARDCGLRQIEAEDRREHPGAGGYRAIHLDFEVVDPSARGLSPDVGVEVQVTTAIFDAHARVCHTALYAAAFRNRVDIEQRLERLGEAAARLDDGLAAIDAEADGEKSWTGH
jgi:ppGpp synthetase/RelA/SpoT-type nucleotidyltranferase